MELEWHSEGSDKEHAGVSELWRAIEDSKGGEHTRADRKELRANIVKGCN